MNLKNELNTSKKPLQNELDDSSSIIIEETSTGDPKDLEKFTALGENMAEDNISETPIDGKLPQYSEDDDEDIILTANTFVLQNPDFPLPHGMKLRSLRATGQITVGNSHVDIDVGLLTNRMKVLSAQVKCLVAGNISAGYWHACYYFNGSNIQNIDSVDLLDTIGIGWEAPFDENANSAIPPTGSGNYIRIYLDNPVAAPATYAEYDVVVYVMHFNYCQTT